MAGRWVEGLLAVEIEREEYSVPWQGVTYEANYSGYRYPCIIASHHLKMKVGKDAVTEFRARLSHVEQATEATLRRVQAEIENGRRKQNGRLIVPLAS
jgi:hypothetical protein